MTTTETKTLADQLLSLRKAAGLSQHALAELLPEGITRATISNLESGRKASADVYELMAIAKGLNCSFLDLVPDLHDQLLGEAWERGYQAAMEDVRNFTRPAAKQMR